LIAFKSNGTARLQRAFEKSSAGERSVMRPRTMEPMKVDHVRRLAIRLYISSAFLAGGFVFACRPASPTPSPTIEPDAPLIVAHIAGDSIACGPNAPPLETAADSSEVDKQARARPGSPAPRYPPDLRDRSIAGDVRLLFVVDTLGRAEMCTVRIVTSSHPLFTQAVLDVLPRTRFFPAEHNGRKVRQRLLQPWAFRISSRVYP
jgi:TonB family protein